ncbi:sensor histidine kinase [Pseudonocardia sp. KRD291]|uniref:sensor histidine kinase n=1 Tax=Pseudonocardia sp. KRD291 TaxID=2792007 RepID=UPI001C4A742C|nr:sensor histidine kinase [Pseudonocardia sp. KRD291]MBW0103611.1 sensor histidine kinase [Pseudonocardia sp. KRD291]
MVFLYTLPLLRAAVPGWFPPIMGVVLAAGLCAPHLACRSRPLVGFGAVVGAFGIQLVLGVGFLPADVMLCLALYRVAVRRSRQISVAAAAVVALSAVLATVRWDDPDFGTPELGSTLVLVVSVWIWGSMIGVRRAYVAALEDRAAQLERDQENRNRIVVATERARIAREMHDVVSHSLSVVVVMAEGAAVSVRSDPDRAEQAMRTVENTGRTALLEMRRMLGVLRDGGPGSEAPQPGLGQLGALVDDARASGAPVELTTHGTSRALPAGVDLAVFRIVQEALTNARKHAGPNLTRIDVHVQVDDAAVEVRVGDDGRGPSTGGRAGELSGGHGLVGMRERIAAYGGQLRVGARSGGGFEVSASVPLGRTA